MTQKPQQKPKLQNITQSGSEYSQLKPAPSIHQKRISIMSLMNNPQKIQKKNQKNLNRQNCEAPSQSQRIEQKDKKIRQLQEQILYKKMKNDMIQESFNRRHQFQKPLNYPVKIEVLVQGCKILARSNKTFKKHLLRTVITILKSPTKVKSMKSLLIWLVSWTTHLFNFLSNTLIKK